MLLGDAAPAAVIGGVEHRTHLETAPGEPHRFLLDPSDDVGPAAGWRRYGDLATAAGGSAPVDDDPDAGAWLFYTSGTTGRLKGALLSHRNLIAMISHFLVDIAQPTPEDRILHCAPLTHGSGLYALPAMVRGSTQVIATSRSFDAAATWEDVRSGAVSAIAFLAPTMLKLLIEAAGDDTRPAGFRSVVYGGAPITSSDLRAAIGTFGGSLIQIYGQAEAPMSITTVSGAEHLAALEAGSDNALMTAGYAYTCGEVAVLDEETSQPVGPGEVGVIATRGDVVMQGYWNAPEATASTLRDGWLWTGDVGTREPDGRLTLLDREKDVIISGGSNVYPREVEEVLLAHPGVREGVVIGAPDDRWGERIVAVLATEPSWQGRETDMEAELIERCRHELADYKKPRRFEWVDEIPKSAYGKLLRRQVRDRFWQERTRRI